MEVRCPGCDGRLPSASTSCSHCGASLLGALLTIVEPGGDGAPDYAKPDRANVEPEASGYPPGAAPTPRMGPRSALAAIGQPTDASLVMQRFVLIEPAVAADRLTRWSQRSGDVITLGRAVLRADVDGNPGSGCLWSGRVEGRAGLHHGLQELGLLAWDPWRSVVYLRRAQPPVAWTAWYRFGHSVLDEVVAGLRLPRPPSVRRPRSLAVRWRGHL